MRGAQRARERAAVALVAAVLLAPLPSAAQTQPGLSITKTDSADPVEVGSTFTYTIRVTNSGTSPATAVTVTDTLPPEVSFDQSPDCTETGGVATCDLGTLAPGETRTVTVDVVATDPGRAQNQADVQSAEGAAAGTAEATEVCDIIGGAAADSLFGTDAGERICGGGGNDEIHGLGGDDDIVGGTGHDGLHGDDGDDVISGGPGRDRLYGEGGRDVLDGDEHIDILFGGPGDDLLRGGSGSDYLDGQEGDDVLDSGSGVDTCAEDASPPDCYPPSPTDADDARGPLDARRVVTTFGSTASVWKVVTFSRWGVGEMWDRGYFFILIDTKGSGVHEYHILLRSNQRTMKGSLFEGTRKVTDLRVWRDSQKSVSVEIPMDRLRFPRGYFRWRVASQYSGSECRSDWCVDGVVDEGSLVQPV